MKKTLLYFFLGCMSFLNAQESNDNTDKPVSFDINYFYGSILNHNNNILHLIQKHPSGLILSYNKKQAFKHFNQPEFGYSFINTDYKNEIIGNAYGIYAHYNFYAFKRHLMFRLGQGIAHNTNPYDRETNHRNIAFGTKLNSSTYVMLNFKKQNLFNSNFGFQTGLAIIHYSNANIKAPNGSLNSLTFNFGVNYQIDAELDELHESESKIDYKEPIHLVTNLRFGANESDVIGTGVFPFVVPSIYIDKRLTRKSALQFGTDIFLSGFMKEHIKYEHYSGLSDKGLDNDWKRIGLFVGHELFLDHQASIVTQFGYYVYYPYDFESSVYQRIGIKRQIKKNFFASMTLKTHAAKAEAVEFGIGYRFNPKKIIDKNE